MILRVWRLCLWSVTTVAVFNLLSPADAPAQGLPALCAKVISATNVYNDDNNSPYCRNNPPACDVNHRAEVGYRYQVKDATVGYTLIVDSGGYGERGWAPTSAIELFFCSYKTRQMQKRAQPKAATK